MLFYPRPTLSAWKRACLKQLLNAQQDLYIHGASHMHINWYLISHHTHHSMNGRTQKTCLSHHFWGFLSGGSFAAGHFPVTLSKSRRNCQSYFYTETSGCDVLASPCCLYCYFINHLSFWPFVFVTLSFSCLSILGVSNLAFYVLACLGIVFEKECWGVKNCPWSLTLWHPLKQYHCAPSALVSLLKSSTLILYFLLQP